MAQESQNKKENKESSLRKFLSKRMDYIIYVAITACLSPPFVYLANYEKEKREREVIEIVEKNRINEIRIKNINSDGIEDILLTTSGGRDIPFYGIVIGDSIVYKNVDQIRTMYEAEKEAMLYQQDIKTKERLEQFLTE
ncbi:hypothetical protein HYT57_02175 [Candidatus Woesearchaeota archaeon]|nr:hypothetical protein [Candidatus Woesearchaeota archaeon]